MNQVTEKKNNVPQKFNLEEHADQGNEFVTARDTKLPILKILYSNSPVLDESDGKFNDKAYCILCGKQVEDNAKLYPISILQKAIFE